MTRVPQVAVVYADVHYMNFHQSAFLGALRAARPEWAFLDVTRVLRGALAPDAVVEAARQADALVLHGNVFALRHAAIFADGAFYIEGREPARDARYGDMVDALCALPARRLLIGDNIDLHGKTEALGIRADLFEGIAWFFYPERFTPRAAMADDLAESWMDAGLAPEDGYARLGRIAVQIEMAYCLADDEIRTAGAGTIWRCAVPGAPYRRRILARQSLRAAGLREPPFHLARLSRIAAAAAYRGLRWRRPARWSIAFSHRLHNALIARSAAAYTEGSGYDYPVRKFFEIPAQRTLMLCSPHPGMADRGLRDGVTHVTCAPEDVGRLARGIDPASKAARAMVEAAAATVRRLHRAAVRAEQIGGAIERFAAGNLRAARFAEGEFVYDP